MSKTISDDAYFRLRSAVQHAREPGTSGEVAAMRLLDAAEALLETVR